MDKSDLQAILIFARQNGMMNKSFLQVFKWFNIQYSLVNSEYLKNL